LLDKIPGLQRKILISLCQYLRRAEKAGNHSLNQRSA
jgi:hypothetical protein